MADLYSDTYSDIYGSTSGVVVVPSVVAVGASIVAPSLGVNPAPVAVVP